MNGRSSVATGGERNLKMNVDNKKLRIGQVSIQSVNAASLVLFGDADSIAVSSLTDTPADSLILKPLDPLVPSAASGEAHSA